MGMPGLPELIVIFGVLFLLFGAKKLPDLGGALGESIKNFKRGLKDIGADDKPKLTASSQETKSEQEKEQPK